MDMDKKVEAVRINVDENSNDSCYSNQEIKVLLEANGGSINYVSYLLCLKKSKDESITLGPIHIKTDPQYWLNLANMFLQAYKEEERQKEDSQNKGGTHYMQRADEIW